MKGALENLELNRPVSGKDGCRKVKRCFHSVLRAACVNISQMEFFFSRASLWRLRDVPLRGFTTRRHILQGKWYNN